METTFENAKVGDRVWSVEYGWGTVESIGKGIYPINVRFDSGLHTRYNFSGSSWFLERQTYQTLFWDEIKIEAPPRPKRKVIKKVEAWANIYPNEYYVIYESKESADYNAGISRIKCVKLTGEYEVEE